MAVRQLTLYDVLADLVPGAFILVLASVALTIGGLQELKLSIGLGGGLVFVIMSYLVGRSLHALAGQERIKKYRKTLDDRIYRRNQEKEWNGYEPTMSEPAFRKYIKEVGCEPYDKQPIITDQEGRFNRRILEALPTRAASNFREVSEDDICEYPTEFRRFAYSYLFDSATLYQRYNIQETFYRNLWLASTLGWLTFGLLTIIFGIVTAASAIIEPVSPFIWDPIVASLIAILLVASSILFAIRRIQFKYRQERALINDLYLHLQEDTEDKDTAKLP